jgi:hypothetical protein
MLDASSLAGAKVLIAVAAAALIAAEVLRGVRVRRTDRWLLVCAVLAAAAYFAPVMQRGGLVHRWELFHYYLGAKYQPELGYERLYACVTEVDVADGVTNARQRRVRDLHTDVLVTGAEAMARAGSCERALGPARFAAFHSDVRAFRRLFGARSRWEPLFRDHGYNPPPLWTLMGRSLASLHAPTLGFLTLLASFDPLLMAASIALLGWSFGRRVALLAVIFWGTQAPADFSWVGGGFLRQDWLFIAIAGVALAKRDRPALAGAALVTAGLLRLFPAVLLFGLGVSVLASSLRRRSLAPEYRWLLGGALTALVVLGCASSLALGASSYAQFWEHIQLRTGSITNHLGLRTLFAYSPRDSVLRLANDALLDPATPWLSARALRLTQTAIAYRVAAATVIACVGFATWRIRSAWLAVVLSLPLVPALTEPSCYYYSVWVLALPLARLRPAVGVSLLGVAAAGQLLTLGSAQDDARYFELALLYVGSMLVLLVSFTESPRARFETWLRRRPRVRGLAPNQADKMPLSIGDTL